MEKNQRLWEIFILPILLSLVLLAMISVGVFYVVVVVGGGVFRLVYESSLDFYLTFTLSSFSFPLLLPSSFFPLPFLPPFFFFFFKGLIGLLKSISLNTDLKKIKIWMFSQTNDVRVFDELLKNNISQFFPLERIK